MRICFGSDAFQSMTCPLRAIAILSPLLEDARIVQLKGSFGVSGKFTAVLSREPGGSSKSRNASWSIVIRRPRLSKASEAGRSRRAESSRVSLPVVVEVVVEVAFVIVATTGVVGIAFVEGMPLRQWPAFQNRVVPRHEPRASRPSGRKAIERVAASKPLRRVRTSGSTTAPSLSRRGLSRGDKGPAVGREGHVFDPVIRFENRDQVMRLGVPKLDVASDESDHRQKRPAGAVSQKPHRALFGVEVGERGA